MEGGRSERYGNESSESDPDASASPSGPSTSVPRGDREQTADEGHETDNETDIHGRKHKQRATIDTRDDEIELKELRDGPRKVNTAFLPPCVHSTFPKVMVSVLPDTDSATHHTLAPGDGPSRGVASATTPQAQPSALPTRDQRPLDGLRRRTTGRRDYFSCPILHPE